MSQHTPGPWKTGRDDMQSYDGAGEPFTYIYHATLKDGEHLGQPLPLTIGRAEGENNKANARLIASAPDMLAALKWIVAVAYEAGFCDGACDPVKCTWCVARDVIAKAEGAL